MRRSIGALLMATLACGPTVGGDDDGDDDGGGGGTTSSGPGASETDGTNPDADGADASDGSAPGCGLPQEAGAPIVIEVVNNRAVEVRLEGRGCDPPLLVFDGRTQIIWAPDCGWPYCPQVPSDISCGVCDCGQVITALGPGESTTFEWVGNDFGLVEPPPECSCSQSTGAQCWASTLVAEGTYSATTEFREVCTEPDPLSCNEFVPLEEASVTFDYPGDTVVLSIE